MKMRQGVLVYDPKQDRMDVRFGLDEFYGGLHCGQPLDIWLKSRWYPTRIEKSTSWYLIGVDTHDLVGLRVRI